jgi:valyl-tRNA synthetase
MGTDADSRIFQDASRNFPEAERDFDVAFNAIRAIRSSATGYNLNSKLQGKDTFLVSDLLQFAETNETLRAVFFHARNPALAQTYRDASSALSVLIKGCTSFTVVEDEKDIPVGCVGETISPDLSASLLLKVREARFLSV